jgi:hypothetical protein
MAPISSASRTTLAFIPPTARIIPSILKNGRPRYACGRSHRSDSAAPRGLRSRALDLLGRDSEVERDALAPDIGIMPDNKEFRKHRASLSSLNTQALTQIVPNSTGRRLKNTQNM